MPTINQLIRKPRVRAAEISSCARQLSTRRYPIQPAPLKRGVVLKLLQKLQRNQTQLSVKSARVRPY